MFLHCQGNGSLQSTSVIKHTVLSNADGLRHVYVDSLPSLGLDLPKNRSHSEEEYRESSTCATATILNLDNEAESSFNKEKPFIP